MTKHIIVDGSNIATEGRSAPSLAQLNEAVLALMKEFPGAKVSVVVDATFGHRIARKEVAEFNKAVENNELVTPPAGAVGRGDAFVLAIAEKVNGAVLSNDSYQEFHDSYKWLFDDGRLIGGKPVPHVGWVFVTRVPVRSSNNRRPAKVAKIASREDRRAAPAAHKPVSAPKPSPTNARERASNEVLAYLQFVENHPVGTKVKATVSTYAANGMLVKIGEMTGYVPLKAIASPPPRSAREVFKIGDTVQLAVMGYTPARRSVDLGVPAVVAAMPSGGAPPSKKAVASAKKISPSARPAKSAKKSAPATPVRTRKAAAPAKRATVAAKKAQVRPAPAKKSVLKKVVGTRRTPRATSPAAKKSSAPAKRGSTRSR